MVVVRIRVSVNRVGVQMVDKKLPMTCIFVRPDDGPLQQLQILLKLVKISCLLLVNLSHNFVVSPFI